MNSPTIPPEQEAEKLNVDLLGQLQFAINEKHKLQDELQRLKEQYTYVLKATRDAVWDWNLVTNTGSYSSTLETLFGYDPSQLIDGVKFWYESIHPDDKDRVISGIHEAIDNGGKNWQDRYRLKRADGSYAWVLDRGYAIHDSEGKPVRMVGSMQDITLEVEAREALRESEEKFRGIFDRVAVGISIADPQGQFLSVNNAYPKIFGYTREELLSKKISDISHPDEIAGDRQIINDMLSGQPQVMAREKRYIHKSGKIVWGSVFGTVINDSHGVPKYFVGVLEDVTERREVLQKLQENEERLRLVIDSAKLGIWDLDVQTGKLHWDARCKELFGMAPEDHADYEVFLQRVHPDDRQVVDEANRDAIQGIGNGEYDIEYRTIGLRDKKLRWVRAKGRSYKDKNGAPVRYAGTVIDITEKRIQEQHLLEQEERFRLLATSIPQIVWTTDAQGIVNYMSDKWIAYTGNIPSYEKFSFRKLMHPDDLQRIIPRWNECMKAGVTFQDEYRLKNINTNEYRWFSCTTAPLKDHAGNVIKWIGSATDIHDQKMVEIQLEEKVAERTQELSVLNKQLERSNEELEQYAYVTSHDLKEPLRKIQTYNSIITTKYPMQLPPEAAEYLNKIASAAARMGGLIEDLLQYSKLSNPHAFFEPVDINTVIRQLCTEFEYSLQEKGVTVEVGALPVLKAVPVQLRQLFFNLISNSIKFSKHNIPNKISITCTGLTGEETASHPSLNVADSYYKIVFADQGIGFSPQYSDRLFTIFQRFHDSKRFEGHGIGLALCRKIVNNHNGIIWATGEENKGAVFHIILPERLKD